MIFRRFIIEGSRNIAYLIGNEKSGQAIVVDPSGAVPDIINFLQKENLQLKYIINTHAHSDHTAGNNELASQTGAEIMLHEVANIGDVKLKDGEIVEVDGIKIRVIHTPGHTPDSICLVVDGKILTGDTLFVGECGRTDLPGGDSGALYDSLFGKLIKLDDDLEVYPGHDYGEKPDSTLEYEKKHNYVLKPRSKEEFLGFMRE